MISTRCLYNGSFEEFLNTEDNTVFVSYQNKGNGEYYIGCLGVKKEYQGQGIGTLLMKEFMSECADWKVLTLVTPTDKEENIRFYTKRFGFKIIGEEKDGTADVYWFQLNR